GVYWLLHDALPILPDDGVRLLDVDEAAVAGLLQRQRCVDLEDRGDAVLAGVGGAGGAPQRVALVDGVERAGGRDGGAQLGVRGAGPALAVGDVRAADAAELVDGETPLGAGRGRRGPRLAVGAAAEEVDGVAGLEEDADHLLDVDGGALGAEDGDAGVGAHVGDPHQKTSSTRDSTVR